MDRSRSYMAAEAIEAFVEQQEWQLVEIEAGLAEADRGEFARDEDVAKVVGKYVRSVVNNECETYSLDASGVAAA
ncbi:hypothetical protein LAC81_35225 (plasmid) [Ensifer adhaerens]|nr:hypothetical protein [Ensifer adhaerens]MBZ7927198.1 hypothetical protein [Ensifer adhaerens]UAX98393.1 hypothetical protein LAC78_36525 [Ensifer adhaerens]UAY05775.1 hypothetical protein LAC80_35230 [Ensifer adhaerens]UAY13153.1 hypothetical protein LAC81_35225 [Ensifer adhaerens]